MVSGGLPEQRLNMEGHPMLRTMSLIGLCLALGASAAAQQPAPFPILGEMITIVVPATQTNGASATIKVDVPPGGGPPAHIHTREDEVFVVTQGHFRFWHGGMVADGEPGSVVYMPRNEAHQFRNVGTTAGSVVATIMPAGLEQMFLTISQRGLTAPKDLSELVALGKQYGITYVAPLAP
jgi:quercetin dioxygenase-like cupin family protein